MGVIVKWFVLLFCISASQAFATFAPPNNLEIYDDVQAYRVTKANFDRAIALVTKTYGPEISAKGAILHINNLWSDPTVNAEAYQDEINGVPYLMINAYGGLARYGQLTTEGYVGVLCHELGHHIGGPPRVDWASVEGQADYWGFKNCMRRVMSAASAAVAGQSLGDTLASLSREPRPKPTTPDRTKVSRTMTDHPNAQCRLDTFLAALRSMSRPRCWYKP